MSIQQVIKYEGDNSTFVWKHPVEDFNTTSQLIVHETQEAIFFLNGQPMDLFGAGKYTLETQNIPLLRHIINIPTGGVPAFHCEVYFINKTEQMAIPWGTDSKVQYIEPIYGFPISIGAGGEMSLKVIDSKRLLVKLVGTEKVLNRDTISTYFRAFLMTRVKTYMAQVIKENKICIFEIDEHLIEFSNALKERLVRDFADYGIGLERFFVTRVIKSDGDAQYEKFKELYFRQYADIAEAKLKQQVDVIGQQTESQRIIIEAQGLAQKRNIEGYTYQQERGYDVAEKMASNEGVGNFSNMGIGLGMMAGVGEVVGQTMGAVFEDAFSGTKTVSTTTEQNAEVLFCEECGTQILPDSLFCDKCGHSLSTICKCSKCGYVFVRPGKFCPKCGKGRDNE